MKKILSLLILALGFGSVALAQQPPQGEKPQQPTNRPAQVIGEGAAVRPVAVPVKGLKQQGVGQGMFEDKKEALMQRDQLREDFKAEVTAQQQELRERYQAATSSEARNAIKEEAKLDRAEFQEQAEELRADWRTKVSEYFVRRISAAFDRFNTLLDRAEFINARLETTLDELESQGVDTASVREQQALFVAEISKTKSLVSSSQETIKVVIMDGSKEDIRAAFMVLKDEMAAARKGIQEIYKGIRIAVAELRPLLSDDSDIVDGGPGQQVQPIRPQEGALAPQPVEQVQQN